MSLILDALRKMELERKARKQASTGLRQEILNYRGSAQHAENALFLPVTIATLLAATAAGAYLYLAKDSTPPPPATVTATRTPIQPAPVPVPVVTPLPVVDQPKQAVLKQPEQPRTEVSHGGKNQNEPSQTTTDSSLVVSGIAWQDERGLRRAVVNGQLVGEGAVVSGVRVVEIRENRVRFNRNGSIIDVNYP